jgi:hypothetical protein
MINTTILTVVCHHTKSKQTLSNTAMATKEKTQTNEQISFNSCDKYCLVFSSPVQCFLFPRVSEPPSSFPINVVMCRTNQFDCALVLVGEISLIKGKAIFVIHHRCGAVQEAIKVDLPPCV